MLSYFEIISVLKIMKQILIVIGMALAFNSSAHAAFLAQNDSPFDASLRDELPAISQEDSFSCGPDGAHEPLSSGESDSEGGLVCGLSHVIDKPVEVTSFADGDSSDDNYLELMINELTRFTVAPSGYEEDEINQNIEDGEVCSLFSYDS